MTIEYRQGDMLADADATMVVIPTNCLGVMGAGLAKQAADRFEGLRVKQYDERRIIRMGTPRIYVEYHPMVVCLPTKFDWRLPSKIEYVRDGLYFLRGHLQQVKAPQVVAVPALGCGLGGLAWTDVKPLIERYLGDVGHRVIVYEPME
jgi:O-acetyl-ADP-ribose deacetylase (regulator of RNase III)